jgi:hypothetical protein
MGCGAGGDRTHVQTVSNNFAGNIFQYFKELVLSEESGERFVINQKPDLNP